MSIEIRRPTEDEKTAYMAAAYRAFGNHPDSDAQHERIAEATREPDRELAAFDGDQVVGTTGACSLQMTVPGGAVMTVAGVTWVGVIPTHRRRGILRGMIAPQLEDVRERGEPAAILWASESIIYGRFGYGMAIQHERVKIDTRLDTNQTGLRTPAEVESVIRKMDVVMTTRLHGLVLAIKNGVPVIAIDPVAGGAKIKRQAESIDWP